VPTDDVVFIGIGFLSNAVIDNQYAIVTLDGTDMRLDDQPKIIRCPLLTGKEALDAIMANLAFQKR
jgi:hypothetical protein